MKKGKLQSNNKTFLSGDKSFAKISSLPLYRDNVENCLQAQKKVVLHGYKYFSKVSAVGENTISTLKSISKASRSTFIYRFHFDPYFCKSSCLMDLCKAFRKMKGIKDLNIAFRRLDRLNESDVVLPYMTKQIRMIKLRFELPKYYLYTTEKMLRE